MRSVIRAIRGLPYAVGMAFAPRVTALQVAGTLVGDAFGRVGGTHVEALTEARHWLAIALALGASHRPE